MEHVGGGELYDYIVKHGKLSEPEACHFFYQLLLAIEHLDSLGISHRDIKPENILLDSDNNLKLIDFGLGRLYESKEELQTACGSPCYAAPEMVARKKYDGTMVDIWSAGVTLFAMLCGHLPFDDNDLSTLYLKILKGDYQITTTLSQESRDLISKILVTDPKSRYTIQQIKDHPWMKLRFLHSFQKPLNHSKYELDNRVITKLVDSGIDRDILIKSIVENHHNMLSTLYYMIKLKDLSDSELQKFKLELVDIGLPSSGRDQSTKITNRGSSTHSQVSSVPSRIVRDVSQMKTTPREEEKSESSTKKKSKDIPIKGKKTALSKELAEKRKALKEKLRKQALKQAQKMIELQSSKSKTSVEISKTTRSSKYKSPRLERLLKNGGKLDLRKTSKVSISSKQKSIKNKTDEATSRMQTDRTDQLKSPKDDNGTRKGLRKTTTSNQSTRKSILNKIISTRMSTKNKISGSLAESSNLITTQNNISVRSQTGVNRKGGSFKKPFENKSITDTLELNMQRDMSNTKPPSRLASIQKSLVIEKTPGSSRKGVIQNFKNLLQGRDSSNKPAQEKNILFKSLDSPSLEVEIKKPGLGGKSKLSNIFNSKKTSPNTLQKKSRKGSMQVDTQGDCNLMKKCEPMNPSTRPKFTLKTIPGKQGPISLDFTFSESTEALKSKIENLLVSNSIECTESKPDVITCKKNKVKANIELKRATEGIISTKFSYGIGSLRNDPDFAFELEQMLLTI